MELVPLAFSAALNPTLFAATTVMLLAAEPRRLMFGYLLGAMVTSIGLGLAIVYLLEGSDFVETAEKTINPAISIALGLLALALAALLASGADARLRNGAGKLRMAKAGRHKPSRPPRWRRALDSGTPGATFLVGAALTLPGAAYLAALAQIAKDDLTFAGTALSILAFNLIMLALLEVPLLLYWLAPESTPARVRRLQRALNRGGRTLATRLALALGALLIVRGMVEAAVA